MLLALPTQILLLAVQGHLFVSSFANDYILRVNASDGALLQTFGSDAELDCPEGLVIGPDGHLYVVRRRHIINHSKNMLEMYMAAGPFPGSPALILESQASFLLQHIVRYEVSTGRYLGQFAPSPSNQQDTPRPMQMPTELESGTERVMTTVDSSMAEGTTTQPLLGAEDLVFDWNGDLHVTAYYQNAIHK